MKKNILLSAIFLLWAASAMANELPPYSEVHSLLPFYSLEADQEGPAIEMYPNPVTDSRLTIKSGEDFRHIQIMNITGEIVFSQDYPDGTNSAVIELNKLKNGMYLVRVAFTGRPNYTGKIIVK
jgi:hypothetical protein